MVFNIYQICFYMFSGFIFGSHLTTMERSNFAVVLSDLSVGALVGIYQLKLEHKRAPYVVYDPTGDDDGPLKQTKRSTLRAMGCGMDWELPRGATWDMPHMIQDLERYFGAQCENLDIDLFVLSSADTNSLANFLSILRRATGCGTFIRVVTSQAYKYNPSVDLVLKRFRGQVPLLYSYNLPDQFLELSSTSPLFQVHQLSETAKLSPRLICPNFHLVSEQHRTEMCRLYQQLCLEPNRSNFDVYVSQLKLLCALEGTPLSYEEYFGPADVRDAFVVYGLLYHQRVPNEMQESGMGAEQTLVLRSNDDTYFRRFGRALLQRVAQIQ